MRITSFSTLTIASLALLFSACGGSGNTTTSTTTTTNTANKSNTAVATNSNQTTTTNSAPVSNTAPTPTPAAKSDKSEASNVNGELQVGKTESVILYVGKESGDYAGYCFTNDSEAGRAILAACKNGDQCAVTGTIDYQGGCKVPGLEATLSESGRILKVESVKSSGHKK